MRIAVIGHIKGFGCGSMAYRLAEIFDREHTVYRIPVHNFPALNEDGYREIHRISALLGDKVKITDYIVVTQSQILIHNDTKIPLLLYKQERVDPHGTVNNPTFVLKKLEVIEDFQIYKNVVFPTIDLHRYDPNEEKSILISDMEWVPKPFEEYIDIMEKSQHAIIYQRVHETDCLTVRVLEALACKTIPIIFYKTNYLRVLYNMMGINETNAYFVCTSKSYDMIIKEYDIEKANRGYDLVQKYYSTKVLAAKIMSMIEEPCVVKVE